MCFSWKKSVLILVGIFLSLILIGAFFIFARSYTTLVLLQNTDEKRATGGFIGSVAVVDHRGLHIRNWQIYDIYESDGQIKNFLSAPSAVAQYLTAGADELHLPDANWERDFPTTAQNISTLFVRAGRPQPDFVISLNLPVIESLLVRFGDLAIESTNGAKITLAADNFAALAHQNRRQFFPGDTQKTDFLRPAASALQTHLQSLSFSEKIQLFSFLWQQARAGQMNFFAFDPFFQTCFRFFRLTGETSQRRHSCHQIYWVESNVGANKSNRLITRQLLTPVFQTATPSARLAVSWLNHNQIPLTLDSSWQDRLHYANYQRLLLPPAVNLVSATLDGVPLSSDTFDFRSVVDADGEVWQEIGFLVIINEQTSRQLEVILTDPVAAAKKSAACWQTDFN